MEINNSISLSDQIYHEVKERIKNSTYPGGTALTEAALAEEFNTSKSPVKVAIGRLVTEGWLVTGYRKKVYVKELTEKQIKDYYGIRELFEKAAIDKIFEERRTREYSFKLEEILVHARAGIDDYYAFETADAEFHKALISVFDNDKILDFYTNLTDELVRVNVFIHKFRAVRDNQYQYLLYNELNRFMLAIRNNDYEKAIEYMIDQHMHNALNESLEVLSAGVK